MDKIVDLLIGNGSNLVIIILIAMILFIIAHADKVSLIMSSFWGLFSNFIVFAKKKQMSTKVSGAVTCSVKNQGIKSNIIPSSLKVEWINKETPETFIENKQVIVRIKQSSNPHENLVTAVSEYVNNGLLHNVKRYLNKDVMDASRMLMTRKVIQETGKTSLTYLEENYIIPKLNADIELEELYSDLVQIDHNGMFVGILLNEFNKSGMKLYGDVQDPELVAESKEFMRYLHKIAIGISNDPSDLCFNRDYFKVVIFLTASTRTLKKAGITPFIKAASNQLKDGIETIYVFGLGSKQETARQISEELDTDYRIEKITKHTYRHINESGRRIPGVFYECEIFKNSEKDTH